MSQRLTDEQLAAIEERANKATPGPWYAVDADDDYAMCASCVATSRDVGNLDPQTVERDEIVAITLLQHPRLAEHKSQKWDENTDFIANARTDVPALLSYVRCLQTEASNLRHQLASTQTSANLARGIAERARQEKDEAKGECERLKAAVEVAELERDVIAGWLTENLSEGQAARLLGVDRLEARAIRDTAIQQSEVRWKEAR